MIRKSHFLLALALALAAAAIGVPVAQAAVKSPYAYLGHPNSQGGIDRVSTAAMTAAAVKSPYAYLGHPNSQGGIDRVSTAAGRPIDPLAASTSSPQGVGSTVFQWGDAGIGAGFTLGIVLILAGAGAGLLVTRQNRHQQSGHAQPSSS